MPCRVFIGKLFLFALIFIALNGLLSHAYAAAILSHNLLMRVDKQYEQLDTDVRILILGDSHSGRGIDPDLIGGAFNFSSYGENYTQTYFKLRRLLNDDLVDLEAVILPIDLHSFSSFRADRFRDPYYWEKYINYVELGRFKDDLPGYLEQRLRGEISYLADVEDTIDYLRNRKKISQRMQPLRKGFLPSNRKYSWAQNPLDHARRRTNAHLKGSDYLDEDLAYHFQCILDMCFQRQLCVVLVKFPVSYEYYDLASKLMPVELFYKEVDALIRPECGVELLDYQKEFFGKNHLFENSDHLNFAGAWRFSKLLKKDLQRLGVLR